MEPDHNDFSVDLANQKPYYHPHMTAPCLLNQLSLDFKIDLGDFKIFTVTRNPLDMLSSYYRFFSPDINGRYNYQDDHIDSLQDFNQWLVTGRVGMAPAWKENCPAFISQNDFTPLSLEAHIMNRLNEICVTNYFRIEDIGSIENWLSEVLSKRVSLPRVNSSEAKSDLNISDAALARVQKCFPLERHLYSF